MIVFHLAVLVGVFMVIYFTISLSIHLFLVNFPRNSVDEQPDWGEVLDYRVPSHGKAMECWVVHPDGPEDSDNRPAILLVHGWGRNRGRMVSIARIYGKNGYTTILISVRDHGKSDKMMTGMSILRFSQDIDSCINWWGKPVIVTGHSIGAGAALIVAARNPLIKAVIAEATPLAFPYNLRHVYRPALRWLTPLLMPGITILTLAKHRKNSRSEYSPLDAAPGITVPVFLVHGKDDEIFPWQQTLVLQKAINNCKTWIIDGADHSSIEEHPDYANQVLGFIESVN